MAAAKATPGAQVRRRLRWRDELVTVLLGSWLMIGLVVDGWAHTNLAELETFFTPWHALFYSGFVATASWICWQAMRAQEQGLRGAAAIPVGYASAFAGIGIFTAGGLSDMAWHTLRGVEQNLEALFSPPHLLLAVGIVLILSSPLRAAWSRDPAGSAPGFVAFLPTLLSVTLVTSLVAFMFMFFAAYTSNGASQEAVRWAARRGGALPYFLQISTLAAIFASTLLLVAPLLLMVRRWRLPFGAATLLVVTIATVTAALEEFAVPAYLVAAAVAGLLIDALIRVLRPSTSRPASMWALGGVAPLLLWSAWFAAVQWADAGIGWTLEMWSGTIIWSGLLGCMLALLMAPPPIAPEADAPTLR